MAMTKKKNESDRPKKNPKPTEEYIDVIVKDRQEREDEQRETVGGVDREEARYREVFKNARGNKLLHYWTNKDDGSIKNRIDQLTGFLLKPDKLTQLGDALASISNELGKNASIEEKKEAIDSLYLAVNQNQNLNDGLLKTLGKLARLKKEKRDTAYASVMEDVNPQLDPNILSTMAENPEYAKEVKTFVTGQMPRLAAASASDPKVYRSVMNTIVNGVRSLHVRYEKA